MRIISPPNSTGKPSRPQFRFASLTRGEQIAAIAEVEEALIDLGDGSLRWADAEQWGNGFLPAMMDLFARYDLSGCAVYNMVWNYIESHLRTLYAAAEAPLKARERPNRTDEEMRENGKTLKYLAAKIKAWRDFKDAIIEAQLREPKISFTDHPLRGVALAGIAERMRIRAEIDELGSDTRLIPPPSPEELARRETQRQAALAALGIVNRIARDCNRLQRGEGLTRRERCGGGLPIALQNIAEPHRIRGHLHYCGRTDCPRCEAHGRARMLQDAIQMILYDVPDGGVLHARHQDRLSGDDPRWRCEPSSRMDGSRAGWRTTPVYVVECEERRWPAIQRRIARLAGAVGAAGRARLSRPGYVYRRRNGKYLVITEAPVPDSRELPPAEVAAVMADAIDTGLYPTHPRRRSDIRFGGRWMPRRLSPEWRRIECLCPIDEMGYLADEHGAVDVRDLPPSASLGRGVEVQFPSAAGASDAETALDAEMSLRNFLSALAAGGVDFIPTYSSCNRRKTDTASSEAANGHPEAASCGADTPWG